MASRSPLRPSNCFVGSFAVVFAEARSEVILGQEHDSALRGGFLRTTGHEYQLALADASSQAARELRP
jgi:hypothetical protein